MYKLTIIFVLSCVALAMPARGEVIAVKSLSPGADEVGAIDAARREAAMALLPTVREKVELALRERGLPPTAAPRDELLVSVIGDQLKSSRNVFRTTVRQESREYGQIYFADWTLD